MTCIEDTYLIDFNYVLQKQPHITKEELKAIPDVDVHNLYKQNYWDKCRCDDLPAGVDYAVFDASVNMGVGRAAKLIQEAVGVVADGIIGNGTIEAINKTNPRSILENFSVEKQNFYKSLPTFETFGKGWLNRVAEVKTSAESMLA